MPRKAPFARSQALDGVVRSFCKLFSIWRSLQQSCSRSAALAPASRLRATALARQAPLTQALAQNCQPPRVALNPGVPRGSCPQRSATHPETVVPRHYAGNRGPEAVPRLLVHSPSRTAPKPSDRARSVEIRGTPGPVVHKAANDPQAERYLSLSRPECRRASVALKSGVPPGSCPQPTWLSTARASAPGTVGPRW